MNEARLRAEPTWRYVGALSIESFESKGISPGVHLTLTTAQETLSVHLGPEWYISGQDTRLAPGDSIEVTGSRITFEGKPVIIASKITKGAEVLLLRDDAGFPAWVDWRRHK
jgi:hypothetical protein